MRRLICKIAFGMGLDRVDVTHVIHWALASDLESYMQKCGRAGQNGKPSSALLYVKKSDLNNKKNFKGHDKVLYSGEKLQKSFTVFLF